MKSSGQTRLPTASSAAQRADRADPQHPVASLLDQRRAGWRGDRSCEAGRRHSPAAPWRCTIAAPCSAAAAAIWSPPGPSALLPRITASRPIVRRSYAAPRPEGRSRLVVVDDRLGIAEPAEAIEQPGPVDRLSARPPQLRQVAAHVGALGVEALGLAQGVEDAVGTGVVAGPSHPLPVAGVVGDLAVGEQVPEVPGGTWPANRCRGPWSGTRPRSSGAVVHEALRGQLPHRRIDDRVAGAGPPARPPAPAASATSGRGAGGSRAAAARGWRRAPGGGSRASRAGGRRPHRPCRSAPLASAPAAKCSRSAGRR